MSCCSKNSKCTPANTDAGSSTNKTDIYKLVQDHYGDHAKATSGTTDAAAYSEKVAQAFGYSKEDLESIPADANLGVSCGNPLAMSGLKEGETSIDLGSGAGLDVFLAAKKVGSTGKAIGIDMTDEMLALANKNAAKGGYTNTEFIKALITSIPLPDNTADCITSNCVINLVPDAEKPQVFREIYRLLKPGGRMAVSDILAKKDLPKEIKEDALLYIGCISGASLVGQYQAWMNDAGFQDIIILDTNRDLNVYKEGILSDGKTGGGCCAPTLATGSSDGKSGGCCAPTLAAGSSDDKKGSLVQYDLNEWTGAYQIYAVKPAV